VDRVPQIREATLNQEFAKERRIGGVENVPSGASRFAVLGIDSPEHSIESIRNVHMEFGGAMVKVIWHSLSGVVHFWPYN
jgi:hypothetical protein